MKFAVLILLSLICFSCKTPRPECISDSNKGVVLRWGTIDNIVKSSHFYELDSFAKIYEIQLDSNNNQIRNELGKIENNDYCNLIELVITTLVETQALNSPGEIQNFVDYLNLDNNMLMRAAWNPKFSTKGNKAYRAVYDSLNIRVIHLK